MFVMLIFPVAFVPVPIAIVVVVPIFIIPVVVAPIFVSLDTTSRGCQNPADFGGSDEAII
jgi:hypothetical protein